MNLLFLNSIVFTSFYWQHSELNDNFLFLFFSWREIRGHFIIDYIRAYMVIYHSTIWCGIIYTYSRIRDRKQCLLFLIITRIEEYMRCNNFSIYWTNLPLAIFKNVLNNETMNTIYRRWYIHNPITKFESSYINHLRVLFHSTGIMLCSLHFHVWKIQTSYGNADVPLKKTYTYELACLNEMQSSFVGQDT